MNEQSFVARLSRISQGFTEAKIILAAVELGLFDRLSKRAATATELAAELEVTERGIEILADALVANAYLHKKGAHYNNTAEVDRYLVRDSPDSVAYITGHRNQMFRSWARLEDVIRHGQQRAERDKATLSDPEANRNFILGMVEVSRQRVGPVIDRLPLKGAQLLIDLGGGPGQYACEAVRRHPALRATVVDLPLTIEVAKEYIAAQQLSAQVTTMVCDFFREPSLPLEQPADLVFISQVLHAEGPAENCALLATLRSHLRPGGWVVVSENLVDPSRTNPVQAAMFAVNMLAGTTRGRTYTAEEITAWLAQAGYEPATVEHVAERTSLISARAR